MAFLRVFPGMRVCRLHLVAALTACIAFATPATAQQRLYEPKIEAGLIYNFLKYTSWPNHAPGKGRLRVCLLNGDPFNGYLDPLQGRTAQQSRIDIVPIDDYRQMDGCQIVFIPADQEDDMPSIIAYARSKPILTASNTEDFIRKGGMVEFAMRRDQRIHLYIGESALRAANLSISPRLLSLAEKTSQ
jgi:hypothetical protein